MKEWKNAITIKYSSSNIYEKHRTVKYLNSVAKNKRHPVSIDICTFDDVFFWTIYCRNEKIRANWFSNYWFRFVKHILYKLVIFKTGESEVCNSISRSTLNFSKRKEVSDSLESLNSSVVAEVHENHPFGIYSIGIR